MMLVEKWLVGSWRLGVGVLVIVVWGWLSTSPALAHHTEVDGTQAAEQVPQNFIVRTVVSGLNLPTDMVILPSGDFLVTEKGTGSAEFSRARVRLVRGGVLQIEPVLTVGVNALEDSGLLGIVLDPQFAVNGYFYLWYSTGESSLGWDGTSYNRLSRFTYDPISRRADPASETIILDKVPWSSIHNGGGMAFDDEGNLLLTTGDAGAIINSPSLHTAQNLTTLNGKVLRIRPQADGGYTIPEDNPFFQNLLGIREEIYAYGLRNPFRLAQRAANQTFYLAEVGQDTWEEVNEVRPGANYGWPYREGKCEIYQRGDCIPAPEFVDPVLDYVHPEGLGAGITALTFYQGTRWPVAYRDRLFVADFDSDWVKFADLNEATPALRDFGTNLGAVVDMESTSEGIYLLSIYEQSIKFVYFDAEGNHPPTVSWRVRPVSGPAPLRVEFTATAEDEDGDALRYRWDFGDGITATTDISTTNHVYMQDGDYLATLQVVDEDGGTSEILRRLIQVYSGIPATIVQENLTEADRRLYEGGDSIRFSAARLGGLDGLDPVNPYAWTILLHHNEHAHILLADYLANDVTLDIPRVTHALGVPLWYEVQLTMRTANGQRIVTRLDLLPHTTTIQLQSWPGQAMLMLDQQPQVPGARTLLIVGQEYILEAAERMVFEGKVGTFKNWIVTPSWPVTAATDQTVIVTDRVFTLTVPEEASSYIAFYDYVEQATPVYMPSVRR